MPGYVLSIALLVLTSCGGQDDPWTTIATEEVVVETPDGETLLYDTGPVDGCDLTLSRDLHDDDLAPITHRLKPDVIDEYIGGLSTEHTFTDCIGVRYTTEPAADIEAQYQRILEFDGKCKADLFRDGPKFPFDGSDEEKDKWDNERELAEVECERAVATE